MTTVAFSLYAAYCSGGSIQNVRDSRGVAVTLSLASDRDSAPTVSSILNQPISLGSTLVCN